MPRGEGAGRAEPALQRPRRPVCVGVCEQPHSSFSFLPPTTRPRWSPNPQPQEVTVFKARGLKEVLR